MLRKLILAALAAITVNAFAAVDVNQANQAELESVKGIGPALSAKIIKQRESGAYKSWADMVERVPGIGSGNAARFSQGGLTVAGAGYSAEPAAMKPAKPAKAATAAKAAKPEKADGAAKPAPAGSR